MEPYICKCCGAPLKYKPRDEILYCEYCGAAYRQEQSPQLNIIKIHDAPAQVLESKVFIDDFWIKENAEFSAKMVADQMCGSIAKELIFNFVSSCLYSKRLTGYFEITIVDLFSFKI